MKKKRAKLRSEIRSNRVKVTMWLLLFGIMIGVIALVYLSLSGLRDVNAVQSNPTKSQVTPPQSIAQGTGAGEVARYFAFYWLMGDFENAQQYSANGFTISEDSRQGEAWKVESISVWDVSGYKDPKLLKVKVKAVIKLKKGTEREVFLQVPVVRGKEGAYGVYNTPVFIPEPGRPSAPSDNQKMGKVAVSDSAEEKIPVKLNAFFDFFTNDKTDNLKLLFGDGKPRATVKGKLLQVEDPVLFGIKKDRVLAETVAWIEIDGVKTKQNFEFVFTEKAGGDWFIDSTDPYLPIRSTKEE